MTEEVVTAAVTGTGAPDVSEHFALPTEDDERYAAAAAPGARGTSQPG
jgi:hypothetical protein